MPPYSDWLDEHLETFVRPKLGKIPDLKKAKQDKAGQVGAWTPRHIVALHAMWKRVKQVVGERKLLLPGRDVWLLEILARMEGYPSTFEPIISSEVASSRLLPDYSEYHCIDTGFSGSVPKALKCKHWHLMCWRTHPNPLIDLLPPSYGMYEKPMSLTQRQKALIAYSKVLNEHMLFPCVQKPNYKGRPAFVDVPTKSTNPLIATVPKLVKPVVNTVEINKQVILQVPGMLEGCPKYWERGAIQYHPTSNVVKAIKPQKLAEDYFFEQAALMTMLIAESCKKEQRA